MISFLLRAVAGLATLAIFGAIAIATAKDANFASSNLAGVAAKSFAGPFALLGIGIRLMAPDFRLALCWMTGLAAASLAVAAISMTSALLPTEHWSRSLLAGTALETLLLVLSLAGIGFLASLTTRMKKIEYCYALLWGVASFDLLLLLALPDPDNFAGRVGLSISALGAASLLALTRHLSGRRPHEDPSDQGRGSVLAPEQ
jgi:hypothetical protein